MKVLFYSQEFRLMHDLLLSVMEGHDADTADENTAAGRLADVEALVVRPGITVDAALLRSAPRLKLLHQWGVGLENIDLAACRERSVAVCNVPSRGTGNAEGVAEIALLHMLLLGRKYAYAQENARAGKMFSPRGISLWRKKACIVGLGDLGQTVAERLAPLGMTLRGVNRTLLPASRLESMGIGELFPLERLCRAVSGCRFVIATLALAEATRGIFDREFFRAMDADAFFINVARGGLVREDALIEALNDGRPAGAGLDVLKDEPPHPDNPLLTHPRVTLTPHIGGNTDESQKGIPDFIRGNIDRLSRGEPLLSRRDEE